MALTQEEIHAYNDALLVRIRQLCVRRSTSITKIEKALGYGNGTVGSWKNAKKKAPFERVEEIADYLNVPVSALTGDGEEAKKPTVKDDELSEYDMEIMELLRLVPEERKPNVTAILKEHLRLSGLIE